MTAATPDSASPTRPAHRLSRWLWLVLLAAAFFRFYGIQWDEGTSSHPDERNVMMIAHQLAWPSSFREYMDESRSPLNPRNHEGIRYFAYGTLPTTILTAASDFINAKRYEDQAILGRVLSTLADLGVVVLVFLIARGLYSGNDRVALLAAFLYAAAVLPIQQSHFFVVDPMANFFSTLCLWALVQAWRAGNAGWRGTAGWLAGGVAFGLALGCKVSLVVLMVPAFPAAFAPLLFEASRGRRARVLGRSAGQYALFLFIGFFTMHIAEPDAFTGWLSLSPRWLSNMKEVIGYSRGTVDIPFTLQWVGRAPLVFPWINMVLWGLGPALGLAAWAAAPWAVWRLCRRAEWAHLLPLSWVLIIFAYHGLQCQMTLRYFLPVYGPLAVLAAWGLVALHDKLPPVLHGWRWVPAVAAAAGTLFWAGAYMHIYAQPYTRVAASRWIYGHVPPGTHLGFEHWDDALPLTLPDTPGQESYKLVELPWYDPENEPQNDKRGNVMNRLDQSDYLILASDKLYGSIPRLPWRYPLAIAYYQALFDGSLGFDLVAEFRQPMELFGLKIYTDSAEEAFSVYDHPRVMIFKKSSRYSSEKMRALFAAVDISHATFTRAPVPVTAGGQPAQEPKRIARTERDILLDDSRWQAQQTSGTWSDLFHRDSLVNRYPVLVWACLLVAMLAAAFPYFFVICRSLPDRGAGLARLFAIAIPSWVLWLAASEEWLRFTAGEWWFIALLAAGGGMLIAYETRRELGAWLHLEWRRLLMGELVFWGAFALCLFVRWHNPDIWHPAWGGEKPMEMTYLYGVMKSDYFPPYNPWYAGGFINYYYFGFVLTGALIKAVGVLPQIGFNLCLATWFALGAGAAFSVTRALFQRQTAAPAPVEPEARPTAAPMAVVRPPGYIWAAVAGTAFVMLFGNLFQGPYIYNRLATLGKPDHDLTIPVVSDAIRAVAGWRHVRAGQAPFMVYPGDLYWCAARAIPTAEPDVPPVTEFPYWSFLYADLHPHLIALPFTIALAGILLAWLRREAAGNTHRALGLLRSAALLGMMAFLLGLFWPTNTWDWPTYGALTGLTLFLSCWTRGPATAGHFFKSILQSVAIFLPILALGYLAFLPFYQHQVSAYGAFRIWHGGRTSLSAYLIVHGFFIFVLASAFWVHLRDPHAQGPVRSIQVWLRLLWERRPGGNRMLRRALAARFREQPAAALFAAGVTGAAYILLVVMVVSRSLALSAGLGIGILLSLVLVVGNRRQPLKAFAFTMAAMGFSLSLLVEHVVLEGDIGRMNTVFKFYYQVWVLFALASAVLLVDVLRALPAWRVKYRCAWAGALAVLTLMALLFPITATPAKMADRFNHDQAPTLDGLAFTGQARYVMPGPGHAEVPLRGDGLAIRWLQDNIRGTPVLLEMNPGEWLYSWGNRFSIHTGLASIVGWDWHERQQQNGLGEACKVKDRIADVQTMYRTADADLTRTLLDKYHVGLIVVGDFERTLGTPEGIAKFGAMNLPVLYNAEGVTIYSVPPKNAVTGLPALAAGR